MALEYAFEMAASSIRFGRGVTREIGMDLAEMGVQKVMVLSDARLAKLQPVATVLQSLRDNRITHALFDRVRVEPTDVSFREAITFATEGGFDAFVAVGGGSTIDTAKAADLYASHPADFLDYVNAPIGKGKPVPGPIKPLIAVPTTSGTGSETTGVAIFDYTPLHAKTGIAHRRLKPLLGILDPENTRSMPPFSGRTSATKRVIPFSRAASARCSSSTEPMPRPWCASSTTSATSASGESWPSRSYRPTAMMRGPLTMMKASRSWWSTLTNRSRSRSGMRGYGEK